MQQYPIKFYMYATCAVFMLLLAVVNLMNLDGLFLFFNITLLVLFTYQVVIQIKQLERWPNLDVFIALVITFIVVVAAARHEGRSIFWYFPLVMIYYHVLPLRLAAIINLVGFASTFIPLQFIFNLDVNARFLIALAMTSLFSFLFAFLSQKQQRLLKSQANTDELTELPNRRALNTELNKLVKTVTRYGVQASLIIFDVDHFKRVNDRFGHVEGDHVLQRMTQLVQQRLRGTDKLYRYGGEEFVIILNHNHLAEAVTLAENLRQLVADTRFITNHPITISSGVIELKSGESWESSLQRADKLLYQAKYSGRNRTESVLMESIEQ